MIHFDLPKEQSSIIKVIGVGGGGSNAVNFMFDQGIEGVNFIICNTDAQAISQSRVPNKIQLGPHLTQGLGAGANPDIGRQATEESLDEIRRILEVNTKMAFITAGMGGGTGTGGAPIISRICRELGILTVGIVTTPFSYEGKKRRAQAEEGISVLKEYVDTLLVISNDKLRHQFGNLTMRAAFSKADNILATAAKCITDVINTTGQINVDFADVCTVMRSGGVAILGSAAASGADRAQKAIEQALNSPLLNDNEIRGARWILININSCAGEHEFTMDEVEVIQNYLLSQAGPDTDVILGMGYDPALGDKLGITLIATGFEHKDPFVKEAPAEAPKEEKIIMTLGMDLEEKPPVQAPVQEKKEEPVIDPMAPVMLDEAAQPNIAVIMPVAEAAAPQSTMAADLSGSTKEKYGELVVEKDKSPAVYMQWLDEVNSFDGSAAPAEKKEHTKLNEITKEAKDAVVATSASGGYLAKPSNIYAETESVGPLPSADKKVAESTSHAQVAKAEEEESSQMQLVIKDEIPAADVPRADQAQSLQVPTSVEDPALRDEAEEQKRKAAERLQKLRNLSFNVNVADPNNEFETVPAYIRRNMELYNTITSVEDFYSKYEVKADDNNQGQITTINTFLDGKKPD